MYYNKNRNVNDKDNDTSMIQYWYILLILIMFIADQQEVDVLYEQFQWSTGTAKDRWQVIFATYTQLELLSRSKT